MGGNKGINLGRPTSALETTRKQEVLAQKGNYDTKNSTAVNKVVDARLLH